MDDPLKSFKKLEKSITTPKKKLKEGHFGIFQHPFSRKTQKLKGDLLVKKKFRKKSLIVRKKTGGGTLWPRPVLYVTLKKKEQLFWFTSLGQIVQFDTLKFRRTFKNYLGQFVWIEKKSLV